MPATKDALDLFMPPEAAEALRSNERTLERWRTTGTGPAFVKIGHRVAYRRIDLEAFVEARRVPHTAAAKGR